MAISLALKAFLPAFKRHHVLVCSDNMMVAHHYLSPLKAVYVTEPRSRLSRGNVAPGEWRLHPESVQMICSVFGRAEGPICSTCLSKTRVGNLHALSVGTSCLEFQPNDCKVIHSDVPKVFSTPFRGQVITLLAFPSSEDKQAPNPLLEYMLSTLASFGTQSSFLYASKANGCRL
ncbi:hypothetical protein H4Q32_005247 [Labeo rohita]|uniref:Uncharacterized protein n=1 Tax=Labeo rohita TaxID=84645 RepID=A0ABQ8N0A1_LABRO|nr:hypothetical protein H4Q32_005247 [Labeo rohita]